MTNWVSFAANRPQAGKDTAANMLVEHYGYVRHSLADHLKAMAYAVDPLVGPIALPSYRSSRQIHLAELVDQVGWEEAKQHPEVRRFLQRLGSEGIRDHVEGDYWVNYLQDHYGHTDKVTVADMRFNNERLALSDMGVTVFIHRPDPEGEFDSVLKHRSEGGIAPADCDYQITNDGTLEDLFLAITLIVPHI